MFKTKVKKVVCALLLCVFLVGMLPSYAFAQEKADPATYTEIEWAYEYSNRDTENNFYNYYTLKMPASMTLNVVVSYSYFWNYASNCTAITIYDTNYDTVYGRTPIVANGPHSFTLKEGTYIVRMENAYTVSFHKSIAAPDFTLSSPKAGYMAVAPKRTDDIYDGYEIRYRLSGKSWSKKTYEVEAGENANIVISKLKKGSKYTVQVRKFVENDEGVKYYSAWTKSQKIKIKK